MEYREKYVRSFTKHEKYGLILPLAHNDPFLYDMGPVLVINAENREQRMLFKNRADWEKYYLFTGKKKYKNQHKDIGAPYKRRHYRLAFYKWEPDETLATIPLKHNYPTTK